MQEDEESRDPSPGEDFSNFIKSVLFSFSLRILGPSRFPVKTV